MQRGSTKKDPALVVFRLCFGTSSEHWEQAGCFRLPLTACRPQPALCVPESFNLRSKFSSRSPRTGQGKFKFKPGKEHDYLPQHPCQCRESSRGKLEKERQRLWGPGSCPRTRHPRHLAGRASTAKLRPTRRLGGDSDSALVALALFLARAAFALSWSRHRLIIRPRTALRSATSTTLHKAPTGHSAPNHATPNSNRMS
jgi:hypothetical protein